MFLSSSLNCCLLEIRDYLAFLFVFTRCSKINITCRFSINTAWMNIWMYKWINWWAQINFIKTNPGLVAGAGNNLSFTSLLWAWSMLSGIARMVLESPWFRGEVEDPQRWSNSTLHGPHGKLRFRWHTNSHSSQGWRFSSEHQALFYQSEWWWCRKFRTEYLGWVRLYIGAGDPVGTKTDRVPALHCLQSGKEGRQMNKQKHRVYEGGTLNVELDSLSFLEGDPG